MSKARKRLIILIVLVSTALALMSYQHNRKPFTFFDLVVSYPYYALNEFTSNIDLTVRRLRKTFAENITLREEVSRLRLEKQQYREIFLENERLKALLSLRELEPRYVSAARVIARGSDKLLNIATLDKGRNSGLEKGMAVLTPKGLVGKVYSVQDSYSDVLLLKDSNFSVAVRLQDSRREGVISGTGNDNCLLKYIPPEEKVEKGEVVITSGFDGIFPEGLPVGVVSNVKKEGIEFFQYIEVQPFQSSEKVEEVIVLKQESPRS
ncbi:MAG: rod shape-determining protein MreC [Nitrospirae bacterium]|nr:rod shape-determining protein MreC [Nitrospirota bacterium]